MIRFTRTSLFLLIAAVLSVAGCSRAQKERTVNPADLNECDTAPDEQVGILACKRAITVA